MGENSDLELRILASLRRIVRAVDLHSRQLIAQRGITGPQLVALRDIARLGPVSVGALARSIHLSQPTVSGIIDRLVAKHLVRRDRAGDDRRQVLVTATPAGAAALRDAPPLLQDRFRQELARLPDWERTAMLAMLQRIAAMMDAESLPSEPIVATGPIPAPLEEEAPETADASEASETPPRGRA